MNQTFRVIFYWAAGSSPLWNEFAERSDTQGWPAARFLATMAEHEIAERDRRRIARHLNSAHLLPGKTLEKTSSSPKYR